MLITTEQISLPIEVWLTEGINFNLWKTDQKSVIKFCEESLLFQDISSLLNSSERPIYESAQNQKLAHLIF